MVHRRRRGGAWQVDGHRARRFLCGWRASGAFAHGHQVAAGILPAVEGGILPPGPEPEVLDLLARRAALPPGETPGSTAGRMPATTAPGGGPHWPGPNILAIRRIYQSVIGWPAKIQRAAAIEM